MALIKCHECGNDISTEAASCPQCGAKPKLMPTKPAIWKKVFIGAIVLLGFIAWVESATNSTGKSSDAEQKKGPPADFSRPLVTGSPNESSKSNVTSNADTFTNDQEAKKTIDDFAQSKGITVDQLDRRVGMKNNDLMAWVAALMKAPDASSDTIYERLGFVSNIETLNTLEDAKTPENSLDQKIDADPEFSITATELTNAYQQNISDADARFKGHRFLISGNLVENIINIPGNPPRINFFFGFLQGGTFQGREEIWAPLQSRSKYGLGAFDKERFAQLKKGEAVSLLCTGAGVAKGGIGGGALEDCTHVTKK